MAWLLYPQERPGTHCIGGWVGPRAGLDWCGKSCLQPGFDPRTVQSVASRYTDWAIPAPQKCLYSHKYRSISISNHFWKQWHKKYTLKEPVVLITATVMPRDTWRCVPAVCGIIHEMLILYSNGLQLTKCEYWLLLWTYRSWTALCITLHA